LVAAPTSYVPAGLPRVSVVINTLNEEATIAGCVRSVGGLADEIVVADMHSTDRTVEIARGLGARVVPVEARYGDFGRLRYLAVMQAHYDWVLVIDADERMTPELALRLREIVLENRVDVVLFGNLYWYFGGWVRHGGFFANTWPRFFRRSTFLARYRDAEEAIHNDLSVLRGVENHLVLPKRYYVEHYAYPTIEKYVSKTLGVYARLEAEQHFRSGRRFSVARLVGAPLVEFVRRYVLWLGYRDGLRGFILAILFAAYRFTTWANLWFLERGDRPRQDTPHLPEVRG